MFSIIEVMDKANSPLKRTFLCDSDSDIASLPKSKTNDGDNETTDDIMNSCAVGSVAIVLSPLKVYMLNNNDVWTEMK